MLTSSRHHSFLKSTIHFILKYQIYQSSLWRPSISFISNIFEYYFVIFVYLFAYVQYGRRLLHHCCKWNRMKNWKNTPLIDSKQGQWTQDFYSVSWVKNDSGICGTCGFIFLNSNNWNIKSTLLITFDLSILFFSQFIHTE